MDRLQQYLLVFLGSGLGGASRFGVSQLVAWKLGKPAFPRQAGWIEGADAHVVLKKQPTVVFRITGTLDPSACP